MLVAQILSVIVLAIVFALLEIQIEGRNGWAADLPCWRREKGLLVRLTGGRPITGYHLWMILFVIAMFHFPFLFMDWEAGKELLILGLYCWFSLVEDFAWFVLNPHYGIRRFKKGEIWWHASWLGPVPLLYLWLGGAAAALIVISRVLF